LIGVVVMSNNHEDVAD